MMLWIAILGWSLFALAVGALVAALRQHDQQVEGMSSMSHFWADLYNDLFTRCHTMPAFAVRDHLRYREQHPHPFVPDYFDHGRPRSEVRN